jgi:hypothetical protein
MEAQDVVGLCRFAKLSQEFCIRQRVLHTLNVQAKPFPQSLSILRYITTAIAITCDLQYFSETRYRAAMESLSTSE